MKINCKQFEELIPFYINNELGENLKKAFIEHLHNCPNCHIRFNMLNSIVNDLKNAYNHLTFDSNEEEHIKIEAMADEDTNTNANLSAYIDNELNDDISIQIRKNIVAKPILRKKVENLYNLRKIMTNSFNKEKNNLKTDFSRDVIKRIQSKHEEKESFLPCILFIVFVITVLTMSLIVMKHLL